LSYGGRVGRVNSVSLAGLTLALWKLRLVLALLFFALIIAAAMRSGIDWLKGHGVPRGVGLLVPYLGLFAFVALFLWIVVPRAVEEFGRTTYFGQTLRYRASNRQKTA
jgi:predicted PurR-regulated permease PerM